MDYIYSKTMERNVGSVNQPRAYDSSRRRQQAFETRTAILDVARLRFLADGYASTTIASIADDAGVSVDTVYKTFGNKPGLVRVLCQIALEGQGSVHAENRSDKLQATESDPQVIIRGFGALTREVAPRINPILLLVREVAAADPEMAQLQHDIDRQRLARMTHNARNLSDAGHLRQDMTAKHAAEIMWTYSSPELYQMLVVSRGWTLKRFCDFIADAMIAALLPPSRSEHE